MSLFAKHVPIESEGSNELQTRLLKSPQLVTDSDFLRNLQMIHNYQ